MTESIAQVLGPWANFYVITGSGAGALTGLMFVVITLVNDSGRARRSPEGTHTFSTPTVVHFSVVLFVSAALNAPWRTWVAPAAVFALVGAFGIFYVGLLGWRALRFTAYRPDLEDWIWFTALPLLAYAGFLASAVLLLHAPPDALFGFAASSLLLIFCGIHNSWDVVTYIAVGSTNDDDDDS